ncbi:hypothetical protein [Vibrio agarivorans]|uniref:hypothetical protein n=1 Tax=Vibrio agarivorans TaxID=153622 RepID=UPI0022310910|nr:hypothetical protein [Vibrio agarivorans]
MFKNTFAEFRHSDLFVIMQGSYQLLSAILSTSFRVLGFIGKALVWIGLKIYFYVSR